MSQNPQGTSISRIAVEEFAGHCRRHLVPLTEQVSYFEAVALDGEQRRQILQEPVAAVPKALLDRLPPVRVVVVPFLERGTTAGSPGLVAFEKPEDTRRVPVSTFDVKDEIFLFVATEQQDIADAHYHFYTALAELGCRAASGREFTQFSTLVFNELSRGTRGEVDDASLQLKLKLQRRQRLPGRNTKQMRVYIRQALQDTLTLFLHGLCCDIDVEPGPHQLGSRYLRRRLELLAEMFPPNTGFLLFPEPSAERKPDEEK